MTMIRKTVAAAGGGLDFVLSDATVDRYGDIIEPSGWDLRWFKRNPIALFGHDNSFPIGTWSNLRVEGGKLIGRLNLAARGTSERIDELISLVEQGVLRAVSVGFIPKKSEPIDAEKPYAGVKFLEQELLETSLVSIPANPAALQVAKSLNISDETLSLAFGEQAEMRRRDVPPGVNAVPPASLSRTKPMSTTLTKRIEDAQKSLNDARDALAAHVADDNADAEQTEALAAEIEVRQRTLESLERAEKALGARAAADVDPAKPAAPTVRRPLGLAVREPKPEDLIIRAAVCHAIAHVTGKDPIRVMEDRYRDHEATQIVVRAAVAGATTTQSGWAAELVETAMGAFMESLRPVSVFPRLASLGTSLSFGPGRAAIKLPSRAASPSISGSFVAEGAPIPVRRLGLTSVTLYPHKMGVISVFSREIARLSNPAIEGLLRQEIQADTALTLDTLLLDATAGSAKLLGLAPLAAGGAESLSGRVPAPPDQVEAPVTSPGGARIVISGNLTEVYGADGGLLIRMGIVI